MKTECKKKELNVSEAKTAEDYIKLLLQSEETNWGEVFCRILYHTGMSYEEIGRRTLPQINALMEGAGEQLSIKLGIPYKKEEEQPQEVDNDTRLAQLKQIEHMFR